MAYWSWIKCDRIEYWLCPLGNLIKETPHLTATESITIISISSTLVLHYDTLMGPYQLITTKLYTYQVTIHISHRPIHHIKPVIWIIYWWCFNRITALLHYHYKKPQKWLGWIRRQSDCKPNKSRFGTRRRPDKVFGLVRRSLQNRTPTNYRYTLSSVIRWNPGLDFTMLICEKI